MSAESLNILNISIIYGCRMIPQIILDLSVFFDKNGRNSARFGAL